METQVLLNIGTGRHRYGSIWINGGPGKQVSGKIDPGKNEYGPINLENMLPRGHRVAHQGLVTEEVWSIKKTKCHNRGRSLVKVVSKEWLYCGIIISCTF